MELKLTSQNLARLAALNGFASVSDLAGEVGRNRVTLYTALQRPSAYGPTISALDRALPFRRVRNCETPAANAAHN